jgi:predicted Zn finger-like uncharacterized protein
MSLATRCTACNTVFRVVQDQLKVSEGWVRCGRCGAVFNALEGLFDLEPQPAATTAATAGASEVPQAPDMLADETGQAQPSQTIVAAAPASREVEPAVSMADDLDAPPGPREPFFFPVSAEPVIASAPAAFDDTPASRVAQQDRIDFADARFNAALLAEAGLDVADDDADSLPVPAEPVTAADGPTPEFLRQAERQARWTRPGARWTLSLLSLLLAFGLLLQVALHYRDLVVTLLPATRPALQAACELANCRIEALRRIDDIVIESSALNALPGGDTVRLSVVLRNRGVFPLAMPAIELTLTDAGGQMIARRVLPPADFGIATAAVLPATSEAPLQLVLATSGRRPSGYTVEPFYP